MEKLKTIKWGDFKLDDLFEKVKVKTLKYKVSELKTESTKEYSLPCRTATTKNQGLSCFAPKEGVTILKNVISVSANGHYCAFWHEKEFTILQDSFALKGKKFILNKYNSLFLINMMNMALSQFNWDNKSGWNKIKHICIKLPICNNNTDLNFIENYIKEIEDIQKKNLKVFLEKEKLNSLLLDEEIKAKELFLKKNKKTKIVLIKDLFKIKNNTSIDKCGLNLNGSNVYPYFSRTIFNNGISEYTGYIDEAHKIKGNSIAVGLLKIKFFYMNKDFYAGQFTRTIYPLFEDFNENIGLFFVSLFNKNSDILKNVLVGDFDETFLNTKIEIPVDFNDKLDIDFINNLIQGCKKSAMSNFKYFYNKDPKEKDETVDFESISIEDYQVQSTETIDPTLIDKDIRIKSEIK